MSSKVIRKSFGLVFIVAFISVGFLPAQESTLLPEYLLEEIIQEVSGERAWWHVNYLAQYHRIETSKAYHQAALYVEEKAGEYGLEDVEIEKFVADGKTWYFSHRSNPSWDAEKGVLWIVEPIKKKIADFNEIKVNLATFSRDADVTAELVDVGAGMKAEDYEGRDVKGKLVLASGDVRTVQQYAVFERGASGVISYYTIAWQSTRQPGDFPDQVSWSSISPESDDGQKSTFAFMVSYRTGTMLRNMLAQGQRVVLKAEVKAEVHPGYYEVVTGIIPGTKYPDEELLFIAHLDHYQPGANDNASGSAVLLEIARVFQSMIAQGMIDPPLRSIRFLWVPEIHGTMPYLAAHPEAFKKTFGVMNMDMVGADQKKTQAIFQITRTPNSLPNCFDDVIENFAEFAKDINREISSGDRTLAIISPAGSRNTLDLGIEKYSGGSDHYIFTDGAIGIPAVMFGTWPDVYYHTNEDTPEKVDPTTLKRALFLGVAPAIYLTRVEARDVPRLGMETLSRGRTRITRDEKKAGDFLSVSTPNDLPLAYKEARNIIRQAYLRESATVMSCLRFADGSKAVQDYLKTLKTSLMEEENVSQKRLEGYYLHLCGAAGVKATRVGLTAEERRLQGIVPERAMEYRGPLGGDFLKAKLGEGFDETDLLIWKEIPEGVPSYRNIPYETLNFVDGKRSIAEIRDAVSAEYCTVSLKAVEEYLSVLEKAGIVRNRN